MHFLVIMPNDNRVVVYILERADVAAYEGYKVSEERLTAMPRHGPT